MELEQFNVIHSMFENHYSTTKNHTVANGHDMYKHFYEHFIKEVEHLKECVMQIK